MNKLISLFVILDLIFSIVLINIRRDSTKYFIELQNIEQNIAILNEDYNNLKLERLHLVDNERIKKYAIEKGLYSPTNDEIKFLNWSRNVNSK